MSGPPVIISTNGRGVPVRPVDAGAPVLTVSTNGMGAPIVISERGAPFIVEGLVPPIDWDWQVFALTAGTDGVQWVGYSDGGATRPQPAFGSINRQPTPVTTLLALYDDTNSGVYLAVFAGDFVDQLDGLQISFGGFVMTAFEIELIDGNTWLRFTGLPGDLMPGATYEVEFGFDLSAWTPANLFDGGRRGHWGDYNPATGLLFQDAAGTIPATLPGQPVGRSNRRAGTVDASQATALSRPTLARWPKGGRRNLYNQNVGLWSGEQNTAVMTAGVAPDPMGGNDGASIALAGATSRLYYTLNISEVRNMIYSVYIWASIAGKVGVRAVAIGRQTDGGPLGAFWGGHVSVDLTPGMNRVSVPIPAASAFSIQNYAGGIDNRTEFGGDGLTKTVFVALAQLEFGASITTAQKVASQNDITETGVPDIWHLWNDGGDSLNAAPLPADTYGLAYVDALGAVTVTTETSDGSTPINLLRTTRQAQVILRHGSITAAEEAQIRAYWGGLYV